MNFRRAELWLALACALAAIALFWPRKTPPQEHEPRARAMPAMAALPSGAELVVSLDLTRLRQSALGGLLGGDRKLIGISDVRRICGFDPIEHATEAALAIPEHQHVGDSSNDFGLVVTGDFDQQRIIECAARMIGEQGGRPAKSNLGNFVSVRDRERPGGEIAVKAGGPVLVSGGNYLREMLDAAQGNAPTVLGDEAHAALRSAIGNDGVLVATWILRPGWIDRYLDEEKSDASPLAAMRGGALRVDLSPAPRATLLMVCAGEAEKKELVRFAERLRDDGRKAMRDQLGVDPVRSWSITEEPHDVRVQVDFDALGLARAAARLLAPEAPAPPPSARAPGDASDAP